MRARRPNVAARKNVPVCAMSSSKSLADSNIVDFVQLCDVGKFMVRWAQIAATQNARLGGLRA
jgi:hypothetical protein